MPTPEEMMENLAEEETTTETADEETTWEDQEESTTDESDVSEQPTEEPVKKRHAEQMEWAKKEVEKRKNTTLNVAVKAVSYDPQVLLEIYKTDQKLAKQVWEQLDFSQTEWGSYDKFISSWWKPLQQDDEDKESYYQRRRAEEIHNESIERAERKLAKEVPQEYQDDVKAKFDKIVQWKRLTEDDAIEYLDMAIKYVVKPTNDWSAVAKVATTPVKKSSSTTKTVAYIDPITGKFTTIQE